MKFINTKLISKQILIRRNKPELSYCIESVDYEEYSNGIKEYFFDGYGSDVFNENGNTVEEVQPRSIQSLCYTNHYNFFPIAISVLCESDYMDWIEAIPFHPIQKNYGKELVVLGYEVISAFGMYSPILDNVDNIILQTNMYGLLDNEEEAHQFKTHLERIFREHMPWTVIKLSIHQNIKYHLHKL